MFRKFALAGLLALGSIFFMGQDYVAQELFSRNGYAAYAAYGMGMLLGVLITLTAICSLLWWKERKKLSTTTNTWTIRLR